MVRIHIPCLPLIQDRFHNEIKHNLTGNAYHFPDFRFVGIFTQEWPSKLLGNSLGDYQGKEPVTAYTVVIKETQSNIYGVFFGDDFCYAIQNPNSAFMLDLQHQTMNPIHRMGEYKETE